MAAYTHKRGDSFAMSGALACSSIADWSGYAVRCQIRARDSGRLIKDFGLVQVSADGSFLLSATAHSTERWPAGAAVYDIELRDPTGQVVSSDTLDMTIIEDVTHV